MLLRRAGKVLKETRSKVDIKLVTVFLPFFYIVFLQKCLYFLKVMSECLPTLPAGARLRPWHFLLYRQRCQIEMGLGSLHLVLLENAR